jgi:beta-glucosidase
LFPFGYGLSYSTFRYSGLRVTPTTDDGLDVDVTVANTGPRDADEVPQVYLGAPTTPPAGVQFAERSLVGFTRVHVKAGEKQAVRIHLTSRPLEYWSAEANQWRRADAGRMVFVGSSSRNLPLEAAL